MEKGTSGDWIYTIPKFIALPGDIEPVSVSYASQKPKDKENYSFTTKIPQALLFSDSGDGKGYILTMSDMENVIATTVPTVTVDRINQGVGMVKNLRDGSDIPSSKDAPNLLYYIGHSTDPLLQKLVLTIGKQDFDDVQKQLEALKKTKYKTMATKLLKNMDTVASWNSYMYGHSASKAVKTFTQRYIDKKIRTHNVVTAEKKLAKKNGITHMTNELNFMVKTKEKQVPVQASQLFLGQEMTLSCLATPHP